MFDFLNLFILIVKLYNNFVFFRNIPEKIVNLQTGEEIFLEDYFK